MCFINCFLGQATDDIVLMAQSLEKIFLQKVAQMPEEEVELPPPTPRSKTNRGKGRKSGELVTKCCRIWMNILLLVCLFYFLVSVFVNGMTYFYTLITTQLL